jgi:hypothetical protein
LNRISSKPSAFRAEVRNPRVAAFGPARRSRPAASRRTRSRTLHGGGSPPGANPRGRRMWNEPGTTYRRTGAARQVSRLRYRRRGCSAPRRRTRRSTSAGRGGLPRTQRMRATRLRRSDRAFRPAGARETTSGRIPSCLLGERWRPEHAPTARRPLSARRSRTGG